MSLRAAISSGASDGTLVTTPVPVLTNDISASSVYCNTFLSTYNFLVHISILRKAFFRVRMETQGKKVLCVFGVMWRWQPEDLIHYQSFPYSISTSFTVLHNDKRFFHFCLSKHVKTALRAVTRHIFYIRG